MKEFLQHLAAEIQSRRLFSRGQKILVAVSGGVDSMVLLHALHSLAETMRWQLSVAHFNHQLRGRHSDADEQLVRKTTAALKIPFVIERADVKAFARESRLSIEMAARKLRHEFLVRAAEQRKISTVALAHHADDQVELFFVRLLRGTGGEGLAGMKWSSLSPASREITLVRPLLNVKKTDLLQLATARKIRFRDDATNASSDYLRNRIRNELLPLLERKYQPGLTKSVLRLMDIVGAESETVGHLADNWRHQRRPGFGDLSVAVQRRVLQSQLIALGLTADFELVEAFRKATDVPINIGAGLSGSRDTTGAVTLKKVEPVEFNANELAVALTGRAGQAAFDGALVKWRFDTRKDFKRSRGETACEFFDADKLGSKITLRHWRPGDRFQPIGLRSAAKLQDLLTNAKIPRDLRHELLVAATAGGEIFWVEGLRISEGFKLTPETKHRIIWRWRRQRIK